MNTSQGLHQDYLHKKEAKGKWAVFWVILNGKKLLFYESKKSQQLVGSIQIEVNTKCVVAKRKTYSFPFMVCAVHGRYLFKCETSVRRHQWMTAIHGATKLLRSSPPILMQIEHDSNKMSFHQATDESPSISDGEDPDPLPSGVLRVTSSPAPDSLPFRIRDPKNTPEVTTTEAEPFDISSNPTISIFPYTRQSDGITISNSEREQIGALNLASHSPLGDLNALYATDSSGSTRYRSFPTTPEKGTRSCSVNPQILSTSIVARSKSLNSLTSSGSPSSARFSRHMVSGSDVVDMEC